MLYVGVEGQEKLVRVARCCNVVISSDKNIGVPSYKKNTEEITFNGVQTEDVNCAQTWLLSRHVISLCWW